jgi:hypothetical protein
MWGMPQQLLDDHEFDALLQEESGGGVAEVVEADAAEASLAEEGGEGAGEVGRVDRSALCRGEQGEQPARVQEASAGPQFVQGYAAQGQVPQGDQEADDGQVHHGCDQRGDRVGDAVPRLI